MTSTLSPIINQTLVLKFGGTSVGTADAMRQVVSIIKIEKQQWKNIVVVTSALSGVTDTLLKMASYLTADQSGILEESANDLIRRHDEIAKSLIYDEVLFQSAIQEVNEIIKQVLNLCQAISVLGESTPRVMDTIASAGERMCVRLLAAAIQTAGIPAEVVEATRLIVTDDHYTDAHPDLAKSKLMTCEVLTPILAKGIVPVITGFIASTKNGNITTLGRGGSDYSAALIGAALPADDVWIYTDVNGVMTADPQLVPDAATVPVCSYREIAELAYYGAKVLHPKTIRPVIEAGIGLRVCNTFNPSHPGTRLVAELNARDGVIKAITTVRGLQLVTLEGRGMLGVPGVAARTFDTVAKLGTSVPLITQASSEQSICFAVPVATVNRVLQMLTTAFAHEIESRDIDRVWATEEVGIVSVVGEGMRATPGIAGRIFTALGENEVNVIAIAQGSSEVSISLVIKADSIQKAIRVLHYLIQPPNPAT
ncbi:MAG: aspartate kinase [Chloroflexi bacterium]|nr:MAG: aspartate kinase [Chloroflexota bacterium]MBA4376258.1 aspartate kinase [Anaerolinea sp.]